MRRGPAGVVAALSVPLLVAVAAIRSPTWYPSLDWAQIEMRTRDVPAHLPLVGPTGRFFGDAGAIGHHLGPIDFYLLAPAYRLLGGSSFAFVTSTALVNVAALTVAIWIAHRRGGIRTVVGVAAALALLVHAVGAEALAVPWNPWLPMLWWVVFLLAAWSIACDDVALLPVLAVTGTICVQSHVAYAPSVAVVGLAAAGLVGVREWRSPRVDRHLLRWTLLAAGATALLWLPVVVEQLTNDPGNLTIIRQHFRAAAGATVGLAGALDVWLAHLDPIGFVLGHQRFDGAPVPGAVLFVALVGALVVSVRARSWRSASLCGVVVLAAVANLVSIARIDGDVLAYLVLWTWGTTAMALLAVGVVVVERTRSLVPGRAVLVGAGVVALAATVATSVGARDLRPPLDGISRTLAAGVPVLADELDRDARYLLRVDDPYSDFGLTYGLLNALDREGFDVNLPEAFGSVVASHRLVDLDDAGSVDADIVCAVGPRVAVWRAQPTLREVVFVDAPPDDVARSAELRAEAARRLGEAGLAELVPRLDVNLFQVAVDPRVPPEVVELLEDVLELQAPTACFVPAAF